MNPDIFYQKAASATAAYMPKIFLGVLIFIICAMAGKVVAALGRRAGRRKGREQCDVLVLLGKIGYFFLFTVGVISGLGTAGMNVSALIASLGLTGFALGFALKDAISNFLSGILLLIYRPFRRGDRIQVTGFEGIVTDIDLRHTTLQNNERKVIIPNSNLFINPVVIDHQAAQEPFLQTKTG